MNLPFLPFLLSAAARTVIVLIAIVVGIRVFGKRDVGELNLLDVLMVLLIGNAVQNAITYGSGNLEVALVSAVTLLVADHLLGALFNRVPWLQHRLFGEPTIIVRGGEPDERAMRRQGVEMDELFTAIREEGLNSLEDVYLAVLEDNGAISIIPKEGRES